MDVPVIFMHKSDVYPGRSQEYVGIALKQAKRYNKRVVLLGDSGNKDLDVEHYNVLDYFDDAKWLADNYVHMSTNPAPFEIAATQCGPVLREFMIKEDLEVAALCETDTMLYCNMTDAVNSIGDFIAAYSVPQNQPEYRWSASFHASLWTRSGIDKFCEIIRDGYSTEEGMKRIKSKWDWHKEKKKGGGVCVMTFLWFLSQEVEGIVNLSEIRGGHASTFDHNIRVSENSGPKDFEMERVKGYGGSVKKIIWQDGSPYGHYLPTGEVVRFNALHFNSSSKVLMGVYQTKED